MTLVITIGVLSALVLVVLVLMYNGLIRKRNAVTNAWAQIDVQLKRRYDLIPNMVETVKSYAAHERQTLQMVTRARAQALAAQGPQQQAEAENAWTGALKSLFAVAESYPELKANENFLHLQEELATSENRIAYARQYYNDAVLAYNTAIQVVPYNLLAGAVGMHPREYFQAPGEERGPVHVRF